jgi:SNF2 family DNA or RNA helicase
MTYEYKTKPFNHQAIEFEQHGRDAARGLFWEQGTGKTKSVIDEVADLYEAGLVDGLVVIAPNGVHRNWVSDEIPAHMPDRVLKKTLSHIWYSTDTKAHRESFDATLNHKGLAVLVMSYNAVWTERGRKAWKSFLIKRRCMYVLDESQRVKNPGAKWSKRILGSHAAAPYKRVLSGTPCANSPFDIYNQIRFLDPNVWVPYGIHNFAAFKQYFGMWETWSTRDGQSYPKCIAYRNLEILHQKMEEYGSRVTKDQVLDLPPKLYSKRYFDLTSEQRRLYRQLQDQCYAELTAGLLTAPLAIVRLVRFQQITCGYLPKSDDDQTLEEIPGGNPRLALLGELCDDLEQKAIIWCRFRRDVALISKLLGHGCVVADGSVAGEQRSLNLDAFQKGDIQFLVGNPAAIGMGVTLHAAKTCIYYSNSFSLEQRLQSEDRAHRIGTTSPVEYIDLVAPGTVDVKIVEALRMKVDVSSQITGDTLKEWI